MRTILALTVALCCTTAFGESSPAPQQQAQPILQATGVQGGLIVQVGCGDGQLTAALKAGEGFLVQGLDRDAGCVEKVRQYIRSKGLYGPVSVDRLTGDRLPYVDNLVRLIVIQDPQCKIDDAEALRAFAPAGCCAIFASAREPRVVRKPWPKDLDEWTHDLHGPDNNAVSHDRAVDVLERLQWVGGPRFGRHHDHMSSVSACVSAQGRVFYIIDEGLRASIYLPPQWQLVARDAFSGVVLWKRPIAQWASHLTPLKSGPADLPKRLVAVGDRVYVTLGIQAGVSELDAATGKTLREYPDSAGTEQIVCKDGVLYLAAAGRRKKALPRPTSGSSRSRPPTAGRFGAAASRRSPPIRSPWARTACSTSTDGASVPWRPTRENPFGSRTRLPAFKQKTDGFFAPTLVVAGETVLFSGGENYISQAGPRQQRHHDGASMRPPARQLWRAPHPPSGYRSPEDLLVIGNLVWCGNTTHHGVGSPWVKTVNGKPWAAPASSPAATSTPARWPRRSTRPTDIFWFHHRCYPGKATDRFLLMSRTGIEFIDVAEGNWTMHHWARGACLYGIMPANGMVYAPQHPCACYLMAKISGFCALHRPEEPGARPGARSRLEQGPAYKAVLSGEPASGFHPIPDPPIPIPPTGRCTAATPERSGFAPEPVATELADRWRQELPGPVTAPILADGKLFAAVPSQHTVYALDASAGQTALAIHGRRSRRFGAHLRPRADRFRQQRRLRLLPRCGHRRVDLALPGGAHRAPAHVPRATGVHPSGLRQRAGAG